MDNKDLEIIRKGWTFKQKVKWFYGSVWNAWHRVKEDWKTFRLMLKKGGE